jgi:hypothetical protein
MKSKASLPRERPRNIRLFIFTPMLLWMPSGTSLAQANPTGKANRSEETATMRQKMLQNVPFKGPFFYFFFSFLGQRPE